MQPPVSCRPLDYIPQGFRLMNRMSEAVAVSFTYIKSMLQSMFICYAPPRPTQPSSRSSGSSPSPTLLFTMIHQCLFEHTWSPCEPSFVNDRPIRCFAINAFACIPTIIVSSLTDNVIKSNKCSFSKCLRGRTSSKKNLNALMPLSMFAHPSLSILFVHTVRVISNWPASSLRS